MDLRARLTSSTPHSGRGSGTSLTACRIVSRTFPSASSGSEMGGAHLRCHLSDLKSTISFGW
eukprot:5319000-Pyramimonas_sp.AAC.1